MEPVKGGRKRPYSSGGPRRRTVSHLPYKIPRLQKQQHKEMVKERPRCRKHRRRPHLLMLAHDYNSFEEVRGGVGGVCACWLETHLWHRKRMLMTNVWGYCLSMRHQARSSSKHLLSVLADGCLVHDASYMRHVQISGSAEQVADLICMFTDPSIEIGLLASNEEYREEPVLLHRRGLFPAGFVAPASMCRVPCQNHGEVKLWLWLHPSVLSVVYADMVLHVAAQAEATSSSCRLLLSTEGVVRFSLRGANSTSVLRRVCAPPAESKSPNDAFCRAIIESEALHLLWKEGSVLGTSMLADPPHHTFPEPLPTPTPPAATQGTSSIRKAKAKRIAWPTNKAACASSPLWHEQERRRIREACPKVHDLAAQKEKMKRNALLIRPIDAAFDEEPFRAKMGATSSSSTTTTTATSLQLQQQRSSSTSTTIPIVLIRQEEAMTSTKRSSSLCGWDLLLPCGYGSRIWNALQLAGAHAVGLEEVSYLRQCARLPSFPKDYSETPAGQAYWEERKAQLERVEAKKPRQKRQAPDKWSVPQWLLQSFAKDGDAPVVVRREHYASAFRPRLAVAKVAVSFSPPPLLNFTTMVPISICTSHRGIPKDGDVLYAPTLSELDAWLSHKSRPTALLAFTLSPQNHIVIGNITSGTGGKRRGGATLCTGIGLCDVSLLEQHVHQAAREKHLPCPIVLFRNASSAILRPAFLHISTNYH